MKYIKILIVDIILSSFITVSLFLLLSNMFHIDNYVIRIIGFTLSILIITFKKLIFEKDKKDLILNELKDRFFIVIIFSFFIVNLFAETVIIQYLFVKKEDIESFKNISNIAYLAFSSIIIPLIYFETYINNEKGEYNAG